VISLTSVKRAGTSVSHDTPQSSRGDGHVADCHRCGWRQELHHVSARSRRSNESLKGYRWICDDCMADLTSVAPAQAVATGSAQQPLVLQATHRSVA